MSFVLTLIMLLRLFCVTFPSELGNTVWMKQSRGGKAERHPEHTVTRDAGGTRSALLHLSGSDAL